MGTRARRGCSLLLSAAVSGAGLLSAAGCSGPGATAPPGTAGGYHTRYHDGMRYGLFVPPSYDPARKYPLILYLHGSTDTTSWDFSWYHDPIQSLDPVFVITPKSLQANLGWGGNWEAFTSPDLQNALEILESIEREFSIDTTRLYVNGTSMGGFGTFNILSRRPGLFAGAYAICGGGSTATAAELARTPLWIFHGSADPVVPVQLSRDIYHAIQAAGGTRVRYTEYPGVGHNAWDYTAKERTLDRWLLAQRKGLSPGTPDTVLALRLAVSADRATLTWSPPADTISGGHAVWFYRVYRDGTLLAEVESPTLADSALAAGVARTYAVASVNYYFKESTRSGPAVAATR